MKINQIVIYESMGGTTTSGAVATVESPLGSVQKRTTVAGLQPAEKIMKGKPKKKGPYANSLLEGKMKQLAMDLKAGRDGLTDAEFKKKYGMTKEEMRKSMQQKPEPVKEAKLDEDDLIIVPGKIRRKTGLIPKDHSRIDHEVSMARSDLIATVKNAKSIYDMIKDRSEDEGLEGWVQEKIIKASDYLNAVKEYYDEKMFQHEMTGGVIAGGGVGEGVAEGIENTINIDNMSTEELESFVDEILPTLQELAKQKNKTAREEFNKLKKQYDAALEKIYDIDSMNESILKEKFKSKQQAKLMYAVAGNKDVSKKTGVSQKVAKEYIKKSHGQKVSKLPTKVKSKKD